MGLRRWHRWLLGAAITVLLSGRGSTFQAEPPSDRSASLDGPVSPCAWTHESAQRALARRLGELSVHDETVGSVAARLESDYAVPVSFIETDEDVKISFAMSRPTVQGVLQRIVELAPVYRFATIAGHLLLYPRDTKWDARLDGLHIGPGPRDRVAGQLTDELERRLPAFANFGTNLSGNHDSYVFLDRVSVVGSGSVVELLVQLLGARPSAIFSINKLPVWPSAQLFLGGVHYWQTVKLTSPTKVMHPGETAQLKVIGTFPDGTQRDVTPAACGTVYFVGDEHVLTVSADGLVTSRSIGEAWVQAQNTDHISTLSIQVAKPGSTVTGGSAAPPPRARPRRQGDSRRGG